MALHPLPIVRVREVRRPVRPTHTQTDSLLTLPFGSLPAGSHERFRPSTTQSAFRRRANPTNRTHPTTSANLREGRAHPRATRYPARRRVSADAGHRRPRAAEHRLPGWESSSRSAGRSDSTKLRHEAREACSSRGGHPCRTARRTESPERLRLVACPKARLRPAARTVRPSNEPGCLPVAWNHGSSPGPPAGSSGAERGRPFFTRARVRP
jgi:hypothetical protein